MNLNALKTMNLSDFLEKQSTIQVDGKSIHKASIVNQIFTSDALSKDRLKRVQGLTAGISSEDNTKIVTT